MSRERRALLVSAPAVAGALIVLCRFGAPTGGRETIVLLIAFALTQAGSWAWSTHLQHRFSGEVWHPNLAILTSALVLLEPSAVLFYVTLGTAVGNLMGGARFRAALTNAAFDCLAAAVALTLLALGPGGAGAGTFGLVALGAILSLVTGELLVVAYLSLVERQPARPVLIADARFMVLWAPFLILCGLVAGGAGLHAQWLLLLLLPPLTAVQRGLAEFVKARAERERNRELLEAATFVHASVDSRTVGMAVTDAAKRLLRCESAHISVEEPAPAGDVMAVPLGENGLTGWLVVAAPRFGERFDEGDAELLRALGAIAGTALSNAALVDTIRHQGLHDRLTGLPNQVLFEDRAGQAVIAARRSRGRCAVAVVDVDHFAKINQSLGHAAGNDLLQVIGSRLAGACREADTVARLGADEFTVLIPDVVDVDEALVHVQRLLDSVRRPLMIDGHELFMTASVGVAIFPEDGERASHLLRNADTAMHRAKSAGRDTVRMYDAPMNATARQRLVREGEVHNALLRDEFRLHYQPQVDLVTGSLIGVEALVRWEHPTLGLLGPHEFVPLAEESGLIMALDSWVLRTACMQLADWASAGIAPGRMAVNMSGRHFQSTDRFYDRLVGLLDDTGIDPCLLELEVTEGIAVGEQDSAAAMLQRVRELGVSLAIDDFGTGYSMLGRLQQFPIDKLKIDRSFVSDISETMGAPIVVAMIALARSLDIEVLAEGVETEAQAEFLRAHGCFQAQGWLYGKAVPPSELMAWLGV